MSQPSSLFVLVTAHPDDEAMFFLPTLHHLLRNRQRVWLLCLSRGNYNGLGSKRKHELNKACASIGPFERVICWNDEQNLPDHPTKEWSPGVIARVLEQTLQEERDEHVVIHLLTFDEYGVSGHVNHQSVYNGVRLYLNQQRKQKTPASLQGRLYGWKLYSVHSVWSKYLSFPRDWLWMCWTWFFVQATTGSKPSISFCSSRRKVAVPFDPSRDEYSISMYKPLLSFRAMADHKTQWVWYRRLFVLFSCYTHRNEWSPIQNGAREQDPTKNTRPGGLFSRDDPFHVHKTLGLLVLLSYMGRLSQMGKADMGFATYPKWTIPTLLLHTSLNLSSFVFQIPEKRIKDGSRIWPEFRLHSLVFLSRHSLAVLINWYHQDTSICSNTSLTSWALVLLTMLAADVASIGSSERSIRGLNASVSVKFFFSVSQFLATATVLVGLRRSSLYFFQCLVIQVTAFLLTLRRKHIVPHVANVAMYGVLLGGAISLGCVELVWYHNDGEEPGDVTLLAVVCILGFTAALWRMGPWPYWVPCNKYLVWTILYLVVSNLLQPCLNEEALSGGRPLALTKSQVRLIAVLESAAVFGLGIYKHYGGLENKGM